MCISPAEETLAISTDRGQLYSFSLSSVELNKVVQSPPPSIAPLACSSPCHPPLSLFPSCLSHQSNFPLRSLG